MPQAQEQGAVLAYGNFITVLINFLIIAWILFMLVKASNKMRRSEPAPPPAPSTTEVLTKFATCWSEEAASRAFHALLALA